MKASPRFSQGFAEIVLLVENVYKSAQFYTQVVGLVPIERRKQSGLGFGPENQGHSTPRIFMPSAFFHS
jgi:catechol-2,3-dioxygenase